MDKQIIERAVEAAAKHVPTRGMSVASGVTCECGYWTGREKPGITRPVGVRSGSDGLDWHRATVMLAEVESSITAERDDIEYVDVDLDQIEARAKVAFPGPWDAYTIPADPQGKHGDYSAVAIGDYEMRVPPFTAPFLTADHIAGMSPEVVLALVARVRAAEAERDELRATIARVEALADRVESRMMATAKASEIRKALRGES